MFYAYAALTGLNLLIEQGQFWLRVPEVLPSFEHTGGLWGLLRSNAQQFFGAGISGVISTVGLWFVLRHLFHLREFRADERAAQSGFRIALIEAIRGFQPNATGRPWRSILTLHPSAAHRIDRLASQTPWARLDSLFLGAMAFLVARVIDLLPASSIEGEMPRFGSMNDMLDFVGRTLGDGGLPLYGTEIVHVILVLLVMMLHIYRVAVTQVAVGAAWTSRLSLLWPACIATFTGTFLGQATSWGELSRLAFVSVPWTLTNSLDSTLGSAAMAVGVTWFCTMGIVAVAPRPLRQAPRNWPAQTLWMVASTLLSAVVAQVAVNLVFGGIGLLIGDFPTWEIDGLPYCTRQMIAGFPNLLELTLIMLMSSLLLALPDKYFRRGTSSTPKMDPGWYTLA